MTAAVEAPPAAVPLVVDEPGVYDIPTEVYHADPVPGGSLSSSGARKLLPPSCPALYRYWADNPPEYRAEFSFGHAAHALVLGEGPELVVVDADDWRTKAARQARDEAHTAGLVPLLAHDHEVVVAMADALRAHPLAAALFAPGTGRAEQSLFWTDPDSEVRCRARLDWLRRPTEGRLIVPDYKTTASADPDYLSRSMHQFGYNQQAAFYLDGVTALNLGPDPGFVLVAQEKTPPYLVTVCEPDVEALTWGRTLNRKARDVYRDCTLTGRWPGYADTIVYLPLPPWAEKQHAAAEERGEYDLTGAKS